MKIVNAKRIRNLAAATLIAVAVALGAQLLATGGNVAAYQPDGLRMSLAEMPEPPCPYGHDDGCETAPPLSVVDPYAVDPYFAANPHELLPNSRAGQYRLDQPVSIEYFRQELDSKRARAGNEPEAAGNDPNEGVNSVSYAITSEIAGLPWAADGQTASEKVTLDWLGVLQGYNPSLVSALTQMPFLQDHTPGDRQAIQTLTLISENEPRYAMEIVTDADFADGGGIDNIEAKIIAVMGIPYYNGNTLLISLLTRYGTVEERSVVGRHGNLINFAVVRWLFEEQNSKLMLTAITAVSDAETLMGQALPTDFVGILVEDLPSASGANNGISMQVDAGFDGTRYSDRGRQRVIAHEIGHYWWGNGVGAHHEDWIGEGAAEYIGAYSEWSQFNLNDVSTDFSPCPYYRTIEHLRADNPHYGFDESYGSLCNYSLGERLFINLDRSMTTPQFNAAFRNLHQRLSTYEQDEIDQGLSLLRAFCPGCAANPRNLGSIGHTLARRYGEKILTDSSAPTGYVPGLGTSQSAGILSYRAENFQFGIAEVSASSPDQRRWLRVNFSGVTNPPETVKIQVWQFHEDREAWYAYTQERTVYSWDGRAWFNAYLGSPQRRAIGHHWVYIYNEQGQKIAEAEYQVLP